MNPFPLALGRLDHYTLIVADVEASTRFHMDVLGFGWVREQKINAGSASEGQSDMLNHILHLPGDPSRVVVITEGLTEDSIFSRYLKAHGPGVHHIAFTVDDLTGAFAALEEQGVPMTSNRIVTDPLSGLRQVFLSRENTGYFVELIERTDGAEKGTFKENNMAELANTMKAYLDEEVDEGSPPSEVAAEWSLSAEEVLEFLEDPANLPRWTAHQTVMRDATGQWMERRLIGDIPLNVIADQAGVTFTWATPGDPFTIRFDLQKLGSGVRLSVALPQGISHERTRRTASVIGSELVLLADALGLAVEQKALEQARVEVNQFHLEVYARTGT